MYKKILLTTLVIILAMGQIPSYAIAKTKTQKAMDEIDFVIESTTGIDGEQYDVDTLKKLAKEQGGLFIGDAPGMPYDEYVEAMTYKWKNVSSYKKPKAVKFDIEDSYTYDDLVKIWTKLSRYKGVYLYDIGRSYQGRTMYCIEIDIPIKSDTPKETIIITATTHARETAGTTFVTKLLTTTIQQMYDDNNNLYPSDAYNFFSKYKLAVVPCVNPDGREGVAFDTDNYKYADGQLWKATSSGTDLNRNFPGLSWCLANSQEAADNASRGYDPKKIFYIGDYGGSMPETKALMKFLYYYICIEKAKILLDYHQQGRIGYAGKPWDLQEHQDACKGLADYIFGRMCEGQKNKYYWYTEDEWYGLDGTGATLTDYATAIAYGAKFSPAYGCCVYTDGEKEYTRLEISNLNKNKIKLIEEPNSFFRTMTFEIGYGRDYLGYSDDTRKLLAKEYKNYKFNKILYFVQDYLNSLE